VRKVGRVSPTSCPHDLAMMMVVRALATLPKPSPSTSACPEDLMLSAGPPAMGDRAVLADKVSEYYISGVVIQE
jgi:hypothetical protein